jgi:hypothetical protein
VDRVRAREGVRAINPYSVRVLQLEHDFNEHERLSAQLQQGRSTTDIARAAVKYIGNNSRDGVEHIIAVWLRTVARGLNWCLRV